MLAIIHALEEWRHYVLGLCQYPDQSRAHTRSTSQIITTSDDFNK
jgi:hypothetical protein